MLSRMETLFSLDSMWERVNDECTNPKNKSEYYIEIIINIK